MLSINIQVLNNLGTCTDLLGKWDHSSVPIWLPWRVVVRGCSRWAALLSVTANSLTKAKFAHSIFSNFFSFHRRTKEKSALCWGMWPSDTDVGKNKEKIYIYIYIYNIYIYIYRLNSFFFQNFFVKIPNNLINTNVKFFQRPFISDYISYVLVKVHWPGM